MEGNEAVTGEERQEVKKGERRGSLSEGTDDRQES